MALVLFINEANERIGPLPPSQILSQVDRSRHDLVLVNASHVPPIVRLLPRSLAFRHAQCQLEAATVARLRQREKEIRFPLNMAPHDFEIRWGKMKSLLAKAFRIKMVVEGRKGAAALNMGREALHTRLMERLRDEMGKDLVVLAPPESAMGNLITMVQSASAKPPLVARQRSSPNKDGSQGTTTP